MKKRLLAATVGCVMAGSLAMASPGSAQAPELEAFVAPASVAPGGSVTIQPVNADNGCPRAAGSANWSLGPGSLSGSASITRNGVDFGSWKVTFKAPSTPGTYPVFVTCIDGAGQGVGSYKQMSFTVQAGAAKARPGKPRHTG